MHHWTSIYRKLDVGGRAEAVALASTGPACCRPSPGTIRDTCPPPIRAEIGRSPDARAGPCWCSDQERRPAGRRASGGSLRGWWRWRSRPTREPRRVARGRHHAAGPERLQLGLGDVRRRRSAAGRDLGVRYLRRPVLRRADRGAGGTFISHIRALRHTAPAGGLRPHRLPTAGRCGGRRLSRGCDPRRLRRRPVRAEISRLTSGSAIWTRRCSSPTCCPRPAAGSSRRTVRSSASSPPPARNCPARSRDGVTARRTGDGAPWVSPAPCPAR